MKYLILLIPLFLIGCFSNAPQLTDQGWQQYESGDLSSALSSFNNAASGDPFYADAFNGLGWCYLGMNQLSNARDNFGQCLSLTDTIADSYAGLAIVLPDLADDVAAVDNADSLIGMSPSYVFSHKTSITIAQVRLAKARACCNLGRFSDALAEIQYFDLSFTADPGTSEGQRAILEKLEELLSQH